MTDQGASEDTPWSVVLLNDDATPMDFVVHVLKTVFAFEHDAAIELMQRVHQQGRAECAAYRLQAVAETKVSEVMAFAHHYRQPLQCIAERKP
jgi:ATP-dependent Clp protease adaptor protein ClpS